MILQTTASILWVMGMTHGQDYVRYVTGRYEGALEVT